MWVNIDMMFWVKNKAALITILLSLGLMLIFILFSDSDPAPLAGEVADKLSQEGVTLYVVQDEPESETQRAAFGPYINNFTVVNCTDRVSLCEQEGITDLPVFIFPNLGIELVGSQTIEELKKLLSELNIW